MSMVSDNPAMSRFEMTSGDAVAFVEYQRAGGWIVLIHTEVPEAMSGHGVGSKSVAGVLDRLRSDGTKVVAQCEFVAAFMKRHPCYQGLAADE